MITLGYSHNELQLPDKQYRVQQMYDITVVAIRQRCKLPQQIVWMRWEANATMSVSRCISGPATGGHLRRSSPPDTSDWPWKFREPLVKWKASSDPPLVDIRHANHLPTDFTNWQSQLLSSVNEPPLMVILQAHHSPIRPVWMLLKNDRLD